MYLSLWLVALVARTVQDGVRGRHAKRSQLPAQVLGAEHRSGLAALRSVHVPERRGSGGGQKGIYRSSLDARKPQNPINSEEYQGHLQGVLYST
eukprot:1193996-Prorocentrum_minimum.AAC.7